MTEYQKSMVASAPPCTYVGREEGESCLHLSHLHQYVSAYCLCDEQIERLREDLIAGLAKAKKFTEPVIVDQDGEMFIVCHPAGSFSLCLRWKNYEPLSSSSEGIEEIDWRT